MARATSVRGLMDGWTFKQADDTSENAWMPVKRVPTNVHLDLIDNTKYVVTCSGAGKCTSWQ
jgi:beta-mannosidase